MRAEITIDTNIDGRQHLRPVNWSFTTSDAAELAYRQAIDAINRIYLIPGNANPQPPELGT